MFYSADNVQSQSTPRRLEDSSNVDGRFAIGRSLDNPPSLLTCASSSRLQPRHAAGDPSEKDDCASVSHPASQGNARSLPNELQIAGAHAAASRALHHLTRTNKERNLHRHSIIVFASVSFLHFHAAAAPSVRPASPQNHSSGRDTHDLRHTSPTAATLPPSLIANRRDLLQLHYGSFHGRRLAHRRCHPPAWASSSASMIGCSACSGMFLLLFRPSTMIFGIRVPGAASVLTARIKRTHLATTMVVDGRC